MLSLSKVLLPTLLLLLPTSTLAWPKGGDDAYYLEHTPALLARARLPPSHVDPFQRRDVTKRRVAKRAVCSAASSLRSLAGSSTATASGASASGTAAPSASAQASQLDNGILTVYSTQTTTVWTTKTASSTGAAATATTTAAATVETGSATWFYVGTGACGYTNVATDLVAGIPEAMFDSWPSYSDTTTTSSSNPVCGKVISVTYGSTTVQAKVVDSRSGVGATSVDLSEAAFKALVPGGLDVGIVDVTWTWAA